MTRTVVSAARQDCVIGVDQPFVIIGERINPTGRKLLAAEMREDDYSRVERDAVAQVEAGAAMRDINAGIPLADEPSSSWHFDDWRVSISGCSFPASFYGRFSLALGIGGFCHPLCRLVRRWLPGLTPTRREISVASALGRTSCRQAIWPAPTSWMVVVVRSQFCSRLRMDAQQRLFPACLRRVRIRWTAR